MSDKGFKYEKPEKFGASLTTKRPWNISRLVAVEQINGRVAMVGFFSAVVGELLTGQGMIGQIKSYLSWYMTAWK